MPPRRRPNAKILTPAGWIGLATIIGVAAALTAALAPLLVRR